MTIRQVFHFTLSFTIVVLSVSCSSFPDVKGEKNKAEQEVKLKILQINDVYKIEGLERGEIGGIARMRTLRKELEKEGQPVLVLLAGDFLFPSVMSKYFQARPMVDMLNLLDGDPSASIRILSLLLAIMSLRTRTHGSFLAELPSPISARLPATSVIAPQREMPACHSHSGFTMFMIQSSSMLVAYL